MAPVIRISDATFEGLQQLARPFVDTPDDVISRLLENALTSRQPPASREVVTADRVGNDEALILNPDAPDSLSHTRVRFARFASELVHQPNWNKLLRVAHEVALPKLGSVATLRQASGAHIREGQHTTEGFSFVPNANISIQGLDANSVWLYSLKLARRIAVPIEVVLEWHDKPAAAHPGQTGRLSWSPPSN